MKWIIENTTDGTWRIFFDITAAQKCYDEWSRQIGEGYITIREL